MYRMPATRSTPARLGMLYPLLRIEGLGLTRISGKDAVSAMIKRLAHRNANVQLYTLEVRR